MTSIFSLPQQTFTPLVDAKTGNPLDNTPRVSTFTGSIPSNATPTKVTLTLTRVGWPAGRCVEFFISFPNDPAIAVQGGGADGGPGGTVSSWSISRNDLSSEPTGTYSITVKIWQQITTAATVEYF